MQCCYGEWVSFHWCYTHPLAVCIELSRCISTDGQQKVNPMGLIQVFLMIFSFTKCWPHIAEIYWGQSFLLEGAGEPGQGYNSLLRLTQVCSGARTHCDDGCHVRRNVRIIQFNMGLFSLVYSSFIALSDSLSLSLSRFTPSSPPNPLPRLCLFAEARRSVLAVVSH